MLALLVVLDFSILFYFLSKRQFFLDYDETYYMLLARNLFRGAGYTLNGLYNISFPPLLPLMIGLLSKVTGSEIVALRLITALSGALVLLPVYLLARKIAGMKCAFYTLLLMCAQPACAYFLNLDSRYIMGLYRGSEFFYELLLFTGLYFGFTAFEQGRMRDFAIAALSLAAAFLVRPEAVIYFVLVLIFYLGTHFLQDQDFSPVQGRKILLFACVFCLVLSPYLYYIHRVSGAFILNGKIPVGDSLRESMIELFEKDDWKRFISILYGFDETAQEMKSPVWGVNKEKKISLKDRSGKSDAIEPGIFSFMSRNLKNYSIGMRFLYSPWLWIPALLGIVATVSALIKNRTGVMKELFWGLGFLNSIIIGLGLYMVPRHHMVLIPILCLYTARGIYSLLSRLKGADLSTPIVLTGILIFSIAQSAAGSKNVEKSKFFTIAVSNHKLALELKKTHPGVIMSWHPSIAYYAGSDWQVLPKTSFPCMVEFALKKKVNYIVLSVLEGSYEFVIPAGGKNYLVIDTGDLARGDKIISLEDLAIKEKSDRDGYVIYTLKAGGQDGNRR